MSERAPTPRRGRRLLRPAAACVVLLGLVGYLAVRHDPGGPGPARCTVTAARGGEPYEIEPQQAANAATIQAVASARGLPERAVTIALATAMQESALRNIDYGDRDSVGLFQQRPSQGWGTPEQIMDPVYAAGKFYDHLVEVPGYSRLPLTVAAQRVQRSGFPDAYAKHEPEAALLTAALTGRRAAALTCVPGSASGSASGSAAGDPVRVREKLAREFGRDVLPDPAALGGSGGGGRSAPGPVVSVPVQGEGRGSGTDAGRRGWEVAHWAVAHSLELGIERVSYGNRVWEAERAGEGWRTTRGASRSEVVIATTR
ncbi:heavy metal transporter [Streptomyces sp. TRM 70361]|uniref:heavy metal transporter n=1 Tax=Streptomyces sp. TRM 70361 TaxID=3116553 RepID=UPI002E7B432C|nr:heavy metal transporter [Streptomyces sp. TRM 70361]MEE1939213.1 heavy metal transporter [Streptomyces sp. TRM 70361]